jgi:hypothetical protein
VRLSALTLQLRRKAVTRAHGATLRWRLSRAATVYITFRRAGGGSRQLVVHGRAGSNSLRFAARLQGSALAPGKWSVSVAAKDREGHRTRAQTRGFRVARG